MSTPNDRPFRNPKHYGMTMTDGTKARRAKRRAKKAQTQAQWIKDSGELLEGRVHRYLPVSEEYQAFLDSIPPLKSLAVCRLDEVRKARAASQTNSKEEGTDDD